MKTSFQTLVSKGLCPSLEGWLLQLPQAQEYLLSFSLQNFLGDQPYLGSWALGISKRLWKTISKRPLPNPCNSDPSSWIPIPKTWKNHSSKRFQRHWNTKYRYKAHSTKNEDRGSSTHVHKTTNQFKSSAQRNHFQRVSKLFENCFQEHPQIQVQFKLHGQQFQTTKTNNKLWSSAAGISHLIRDHLNPITATSLDHTSTLVQNDQQQNKEQKQSTMQKRPMSPQMSN